LNRLAGDIFTPSTKSTFVNPIGKPASARSAFTMIEMVAALAIVATLLTAGASLLPDSRSRALRAGTDQLSGMIEKARARAIAMRCDLVLAIAEPGDLPDSDPRTRLGLFRVEKWPAGGEAPAALDAVQIDRWRALPDGISLVAGDLEGLANPLGAPEISLNCKGFRTTVRAIGFHNRGGLRYPVGAAPVVLRIANGNRRGKTDPGANLLKIGRVTARPYRTDG
jgi:prepilin-type N-terminal cleavage/methylation domain-containing protein